jgi:hypothetical protein
MQPFARALLIAGVVLVILALVLQAGSSIPGLGRLPGDIRIERGGFRLYVPITSCVLVSLVLTGLLWLFSRGR